MQLKILFTKQIEIINNSNFIHYFYRRLSLTKNVALFTMKNLSICLLCILSFASNAQTPGHIWAKTFSGSDIDNAQSIAIDGEGNVYSTGRFSDTMDFDPGPGLFQLVSSGTIDIYISKLGAEGQFVWAKRIGGTAINIGISICLDQQGNVYVTGQYNGTVDFDPGPNTYNMTSIGASSFVVKLNPQGDFVWARHIAGGGSGIGVATDSEGNVYVTGGFGGTVDFDPGAGVFNMNVANGKSFVTKLDRDGAFVWAKQMAGSAGAPTDIKIDNIGNVYTVGTFTGTADFDPGSGILNFISRGGADIYISKLNTHGELIWARQQGGAGADLGSAIDVDKKGNVYTAGRFVGTANFDPGAGVLNLNSNGGNDAFISKLDNSGQLKWVRQLGGGTTSDWAFSVSVDDKENVYVTGTFGDSVAVGSRTLISNGGSDIFICQLDSTGSFVWAHSIGGQSNDFGRDIACDYVGNIYVTGDFQSPVVDFDPGIGINELAGEYDPYVLKLGLCGTNTQLYFRDCDSLVYNGHTYSQEGIYDNTFKNVLECDSFVILNVKLGAGFDTTYIVTACDSFQHQDKVYYQSGFYTDSFTTIDLFGCDSIVHLDLTIGNTETPLSINTCDSFVLGNAVYTISGNYTAIFTNQQGCDSIVVLDLEIKGISPEANTNVNGETLIAGNAASYQWLDCNDNYAVIPGAVAQIFSPEKSGAYAVLITNDQGCSDTSICVEIEITTSINDAFRNDNISLYPNPATNHIILTSKNGFRNAEMQIADMYGRILFKNTYIYENQVLIDLSGFTQGIYMFKIIEGTYNKSFKVIKK